MTGAYNRGDPAKKFAKLDQGFDPTEHVDLYLPNDTHWSTAGNRLAALLVERLLTAKGALPWSFWMKG